MASRRVVFYKEVLVKGRDKQHASREVDLPYEVEEVFVRKLETACRVPWRMNIELDGEWECGSGKGRQELGGAPIAHVSPRI